MATLKAHRAFAQLHKDETPRHRPVPEWYQWFPTVVGIAAFGAFVWFVVR